MSIEAMTWALRVPIGGNAKVVLIGLANHAHPDGSNAYPALDTLASYAHCDRSTARRNVRKLIEQGWVIEDGRGPNGQHRFRLPVGLQNATPTGANASGGVASAPKNEAPVPPEPSLTVKGTGESAREGELISDPIPAALRTWFVAEVAERRGGVAPRATADWDRAARILAAKPRGEFKSVVSWGLDRQFWFKKIKTLPSLALHYPDLRAEWAAAQKQRQARNGEDPERAARIAASYEQKYT